MTLSARFILLGQAEGESLAGSEPLSFGGGVDPATGRVIDVHHPLGTCRVQATVLGDNFRCEYEAGGQTLRRVEVAPDLLVATTDLRDRLICWDPSKPDEPQCVLPVSRLCGHSIQDICLVTT